MVFDIQNLRVPGFRLELRLGPLFRNAGVSPAVVFRSAYAILLRP